MPTLGKRSLERLETAHPDIVLVIHKAIEIVDFSVICCHRNKEEQDKAYANKRSTKQWSDSNHNSLPSPAIDLWPYYPGPDWRRDIWMTDKSVIEAVKTMDLAKAATALETIKRWHTMIGIIIGVGHGMGIPLRSGGDWDKDFKFDDHRLIDLPHLERINP